MTIDFYYIGASAPCRSVRLTAKALNIELNLKNISIAAGDHLKPEYLKLNPQHTVPTIVDDGFVLSESRAIITYLVNKYGKGSTLYPEEPKARALVDQRLYFDIGTLYSRFADYMFPRIFAGAPHVEEKWNKLEEGLKIFNTLLEGQKYAAGPNLTVADLSLVNLGRYLEAVDIDIQKYENIKRWYETVKATAPGYKEVDEDGSEYMAQWKQILQKK